MDERRDRRGRGGRRDRAAESESGEQLIEKVIQINRCAAVVKGGRRFSFSALVVVGDGKGRVGIGFGKANEVPQAVDKAVKEGKRKLKPVPVEGDTIPHRTQGRFRSSVVVLVPAVKGTGVIAGGTVRAVMEAAGIRNILTKSLGNTNPVNLIKATLCALEMCRTKDQVEKLRGVKLS
ncbi:MAG: 30S ribosomal protein S5 [Planctomycetes bacterium]|nr:30S ribosomal protein S5 [Planctomycetota bacterium]